MAETRTPQHATHPATTRPAQPDPQRHPAQPAQPGQQGRMTTAQEREYEEQQEREREQQQQREREQQQGVRPETTGAGAHPTDQVPPNEPGAATGVSQTPPPNPADADKNKG